MDENDLLLLRLNNSQHAVDSPIVTATSNSRHKPMHNINKDNYEHRIDTDREHSLLRMYSSSHGADTVSSVVQPGPPPQTNNNNKVLVYAAVSVFVGFILLKYIINK